MTRDSSTVGTSMPPAPDEPGPTAAFDRPDERFTLGDELGRGGMGRVVAATDVALDRAVAIKQVLTMNPADLARFEREVRITARLEHPSIVPIHEAGRDEEGKPFYVMRRIEGEPLGDRIERTTATRDRLALIPNVLAVIDATAFAHARQIIHRDIKPANILLGEYGETLLIDWGLARRVDEDDDPGLEPTDGGNNQLTRAGHAYGTPGYMSPEQARGERVDARTDVYSLGATLFHVVAGKPPFETSTAGERIAMAALGEPAPLDQIGPEVPAELVAIVAKAMAIERDARYPDASAFAADVRAFLAGQLVAAHNYTARERLARFIRRHRVAVAIGTIATILLVSVGVAAIIGIVRARNVAEDARNRALEEKHLVSDGAEIMLLDRASTLAPLDPTRAVALLRRLPASSRHIRRARDIASNAAAHGIVRGSSAHHGQVKGHIHTLAISPDGRSLASSGRGGRIVVHDLATGTSRRVAEIGGNVIGVEWVDGGATLVAHSDMIDGVHLVDVTSANVRVIAPKASVLALWLGKSKDRVRFLDKHTRSLFEIEARGGEPRVLARDVERAWGTGDLGLVFGSDQLRLIRGDAEVALAARNLPSVQPYAVAFAPAGDRVAVALRELVVEWSLDGQELRRWPVPLAHHLLYTNRGLHALNGTGNLSRLGDTTIEISLGSKLHERGMLSWMGPIASGLAIAQDDGKLIIVDDAGITTLPLRQPGTRAIGAASHSMVVATGTVEGTVRWIDLATVTPRHWPVGPSAQLCMNDESNLYINHADREGTLTAIDRQSGRERVLLTHMTFAECFGMIRPDWLVLDGSAGGLLVHRGTAKTHRLDLTPFAVDFARRGVIYAKQREVIELALDGSERSVWTAPGKIMQIALGGTWLVVLLDNKSIIRFDRFNGTSSSLLPIVSSVDNFAITPSGEVWFTSGNGVYRWDGWLVVRLREFDSRINWAVPASNDGLAIALHDGSLWLASRDGVWNRATPGGRTNVFGFSDLVVSGEGADLVVHYLMTNERTRRTLGAKVIAATVSPDGRSVAAKWFPAPAKPFITIYEDVVPSDPALLHAWLDSATNATLDPDSDELRWRDSSHGSR